MSKDPTDQSRTPCILVVEEEAGIRHLLELALSMNGFRVLLAASGEEAIDLYHQRNHDVDLVLMDVRMSGMDGPMTLSKLQKSRKDIRCCFMSGDTSWERSGELLALGARRVFRKPFHSLQEIVNDLRSLLS
jgi:DNA-binding response OmpR family regulator